MNEAKPLYFDYQATTPVDPVVLAAMLPYLSESFGNPSSGHAYGQSARHAVANAREQLAKLLHAEAEEITFTATGTEANNLAIKGWVAPKQRRGEHPHIVTSTIEHPATLAPCKHLASLGCRLTVVTVDRWGVVNLDELKLALRQPTALVSIMHSNNEVGTLQPIRAIAHLAHEAGALLHCDAAQSVGKVAVNVKELEVDLLTVVGHKLYAPKGVGALYVRKGIALEPVIHGAGQESGRRAGTENVPYIVGLGKAAELAQQSLPQSTGHLQQLRDRLWLGLQEKFGDRVILNGHPTNRLPGTLNVSFLGCIGSELLSRIPEIAASTGSACHEGQVHVSPVLTAMGIAPEIARGAVRFSVGRYTIEAEVDQALRLIVKRLPELVLNTPS